MAPAKDGETVPVSLLYRKDTTLDGKAPLLLYGYGAYGMTIPAGFSTNALSLVDRGFVYAIAHVRGGKDKGYRWYKDGKRDEEGEQLHRLHRRRRVPRARKEFTSRGHIVAHGGSAGGMLMGAVANMAPDLFLGIIAEVPFVDVLTTMLDDELAADAAGMAGMGQPDRERGGLPHHCRLLALRQCAGTRPTPTFWRWPGSTDPRVTYWEPAKWVAKLRELAHRRSAHSAAHQYGGRPCRRLAAASSA